MRLPKIKKLMGLLAIGLQMSVVTAMMGVSSLTIQERENIESAIGFLMHLKKRKGTNGAFVDELKRLLSICNEQGLLIVISDFEDKNPDLLMEDAIKSGVENVGYDFEPTQRQKDVFKQALYKTSESIGKRELEILVALTPIPEASKEDIGVGHELFLQMEKHGCISENDTELLQEMLEVLELRVALQTLVKYRREFSPSSSAGDDNDSLSHPIEEVNQDSSTKLANGNESSGLRHIWNVIRTKLSSIASNLNPSSRVIDPGLCVQSETGTSVEILPPPSFSPNEQPLPCLLGALADLRNDSCSRDVDALCCSTSIEDSENKQMAKSVLLKRKRPRAEDKEEYPVEDGKDESGLRDLTDSPPPTKTLCVASSDSEPTAVCSSHLASEFKDGNANDGADTHWKMQSLLVDFTSHTMSDYSESGFHGHSSDPPESVASGSRFGCHDEG